LRASEPDPGAPLLAGLASVVLAAGRGQRFEALSRTLPKTLLPVLGRPLLLWQLEALRELGVREAVIVVGYLRELVEDLVGDGARLGLSVAYVVQAEPLGSAHALACAAERLSRPFLCLLGDVFFDRADLARVARGLEGADGALGVRAVEDPREIAQNFAVTLADGWVRAVEEKPRAVASGWKGVGLYAFRPDFLEVARTTPASALRGERELTDAIGRHLARGARVRAVSCAGRDYNLSGPADLLAANLHALALERRPSWIDPSARVDPEATVERSVVLEHAEVARGARLELALVLPGERVPPGDYREVVFAAGGVIACPGRA
jgi:dTDP-glucose pyrophosphorylase